MKENSVVGPNPSPGSPEDGKELDTGRDIVPSNKEVPVILL